VRIPGKGTFVPASSEQAKIEPDVPLSSTEALIETLRHSISSGAFMRGTPMPQVKYLCIRFKVGSSSVIQAYRELQKRGYVTKIGKTFWVGSFEALTRATSQREVVLFKHDSTDFGDIFTTDMMAPAYRKMDRELSQAGYTLRFESTANLASSLQERIGKRIVPWGLVFHNILPGVFMDVISPVLKDFQHRAQMVEDRAMSVLVDSTLGVLFAKIPRGLHVFGRGHVSTSVARATAEHAAGGKYARIRIFVDEQQPVWKIPAASALLKLWVESSHLNPALRWETIVHRQGSTTDTNEIRQLLSGRFSEDTMRIQLEKYSEPQILQLLQGVKSVDTFEGEFRLPTESELWVFTNSDDAIHAREWFRVHGAGVSSKVGILSLENAPRCYHLGISTCDPDWDRMGHVMAHAISGIFPVEKTTKGFLRTYARLIERTTTQ